MVRFDDLSLRLKMFLAPCFLLAALVGLAGYTLVLLNSNERQLDDLSDGAFQRAALVADARRQAPRRPRAPLSADLGRHQRQRRQAQGGALANALTKQLAGLPAALKEVEATNAGGN